jgi:transposase
VSKEIDSKDFNQKAYKHQILYRELARIAGIKKIGSKRSEFFCIEDNSKVYSKKTTAKNKGLYNQARLECRIYSIGWLPKSPDLNPIEHCWRFIKQRLRNCKPYSRWSLKELTEAVMDIWAYELTQDYFNKWIDSMQD